MGAVHSNKKDESKLSLADRRYRVSTASKDANMTHRRSTRKLGSVALEVQHEDGSQPSAESNWSNLMGRSTANEEGSEDAMVREQHQEQREEEKEEKEENTERDNKKQTRESASRQRSQTLLHFPLSRTENAANSTILLTRTQSVLIENSWKRVKKAAVEGGIGAKILHNVLIAQPDMKLLFGLEKVPQGRLKYEGQFRRHAGLLNRTLEYMVKNVQYMDKLGQHFKALGKKHCQMNGGRPFPANYWDTFLECILQSVLETDGSVSGRYHRCREAAFSWRNLVSFIVQQMRRGFDEERLMRKRFSASLMGLKGSALRDAYNGGGKVPSQRAISGRPRPSLFHHSHGSLGSLEMMSGFFQSHRQNHTNKQNDGTRNEQRERAVSALSCQISQVQQHLQLKQGKIDNWKCEQKERRMSGCNTTTTNSKPFIPFTQTDDRLQPLTAEVSHSSARSASWCAEVSADKFRQLQLNDGTTKRVTRSALTIDDRYQEAFYTPTTKLRTFEQKAKEGFSSSPSSSRACCSPSPRIISTVQLLLSAASSEPFDEITSERTQSSLEIPPIDCEKHSKGRHSFSEFADAGRERVAAIEAAKRMLEMAKKTQLQVADGENSPAERTRHLSAI